MSDIVERLRLSPSGDCLEPGNETKQDIQPLAAGGRAAIRDGGSGNLRPPHPTPVRSSPVTDDRPAPTAEVFPPQNMTTLTPVERCVLREVRHGYADVDDVRCNEIAYVIDRLLSRAGTNGETAGEHAAKCTVKGKKLPERERVANYPATPDSSTLSDAEREVAMSDPDRRLSERLHGIAGHSMSIIIGNMVKEMITELERRESPGYPGHISLTLTDAET